MALQEFNSGWSDFASKMKAVPGKDAISAINQHLQRTYGVNVTPTAIIDAMKGEEVPSEMTAIVRGLLEFALSKTT